MIAVTMFKTRDGCLHDTFLKAEKHVEEQYGELLTRLARNAVRVDKYTDMIAFIEGHLNDFVELSAIQNDKILPPPADED